jgi:hypothetical protein
VGAAKVCRFAGLRVCRCRFSTLQMVRFIIQVPRQMDSPATNFPALQQLAGPCRQSHTNLPWGFYAREAEYHTEMIQAVSSIPCTVVPKRGSPWLRKILWPIFRLLNLISDVALQLISNQGANNFLQSFPNLHSINIPTADSVLPTNTPNSFVLGLMG